MEQQGMTLKQYARFRFFLLVDALQETKKHMDTDESRKQFIVLSVQLHSAKGNVPKSLWRFARVLILTLFALGTLTASAHAASVAPSLPDAPKPHINRIQWSLFAAHAGFRALDVYSTHQAISRGYHEIVLPRAIGEHTGPLLAYSAGTVAADYFAARYLIRHHHPTMAKVLTSIDIAQDAPWAVHNLMLQKAARR